MDDDSEANVQDEVYDAGKEVDSQFLAKAECEPEHDGEDDYVEDEESVAESQVYSMQLVALNSCSGNFLAGKD